MAPTLEVGATGEWADYLRQLLIHYGYFSGQPGGGFDAQVQHGLLQFQKAAGLTPQSGRADQSTWALLGVTPASQLPTATTGGRVVLTTDQPARMQHDPALRAASEYPPAEASHVAPR